LFKRLKKETEPVGDVIIDLCEGSCYWRSLQLGDGALCVGDFNDPKVCWCGGEWCWYPEV